MKITAVETFTVDGGTHPWQFCAVRTDAGLTGYSEIGTESHLCTFQSLHLTAALANVRIMEYDVDAAPWRDDLFTHAPEVAGGEMLVPQRPGWGTDLREDVARRHAWRGGAAR